MSRIQAFAVVIAVSLFSACGGVTTETTASTSPSHGTSTTIPAHAKVISGIQKLPDWDSCSGDCSGETGTDATYSMTQGIATPSLSGAAIRFDIADATPWGTALWWKQLGADDTKMHFVYELSFYLTDPGAAQALEFNVNQNAGEWRYEYATQCDFGDTNTWRVWDPSRLGWTTMGKPCSRPTANTWHQLVWEVERNPTDHNVRFIAVTLDGVRTEVNATAIAVPTYGSGINVAFQMDCIGTFRPWSVWVDDIKLSAW